MPCAVSCACMRHQYEVACACALRLSSGANRRVIGCPSLRFFDNALYLQTYRRMAAPVPPPVATCALPPPNEWVFDYPTSASGCPPPKMHNPATTWPHGIRLNIPLLRKLGMRPEWLRVFEEGADPGFAIPPTANAITKNYDIQPELLPSTKDNIYGLIKV